MSKKQTKIAVMAGTPVDTLLGKNLLNSHGYSNIIELAISKNPIDQTTFQSSTKEEKEYVISNHILKIKEQNCHILFVYCNSLSSSVDFDSLADKYKIKIITPMKVYRNIGKNYTMLTVMAANSHGLVGVETNLYAKNANLKIFGLSMLELVKEIEQQKNPKEIVEHFDFKTLYAYYERIGSEAIILGCTHFPYIKEELEKITNIPIIDIGIFMIDEVISYIEKI